MSATAITVAAVIVLIFKFLFSWRSGRCLMDGM
jgi:hypothetical protein